MFLWAAVVSTIGWVVVGRLLCRRIGVQGNGEVLTPICYQRTSGGGGVEWEMKPMRTAPLLVILGLAVLSTLPLAALAIPSTLLRIGALSVISLIVVFLSLVWSDEVMYCREVKMEPVGAGEQQLTYKPQGGPLHLGQLAAVAVFGIGVGLLVQWAVRPAWVRAAVLIVFLMAVVMAMHWKARRMQDCRRLVPEWYCPRCGKYLRRALGWDSSREHRGGSCYVQTNAARTRRTCRRCGYEAAS